MHGRLGERHGAHGQPACPAGAARARRRGRGAAARGQLDPRAAARPRRRPPARRRAAPWACFLRRFRGRQPRRGRQRSASGEGRPGAGGGPAASPRHAPRARAGAAGPPSAPAPARSMPSFSSPLPPCSHPAFLAPFPRHQHRRASKLSGWFPSAGFPGSRVLGRPRARATGGLSAAPPRGARGGPRRRSRRSGKGCGRTPPACAFPR
mmetsp:Transcript_16361/g.55566  ORF Transcript_16361/g.55566 Transcript_16361/m.55566 type:complete len:208 (+) Transcript_16361:407-1030(+)